MWNKNERQGVGILVTLDGLYGQSTCLLDYFDTSTIVILFLGCFSRGNMSGETLLIEGQYVFEGHVSPGLTLSGKGDFAEHYTKKKFYVVVLLCFIKNWLSMVLRNN